MCVTLAFTPVPRCYGMSSILLPIIGVAPREFHGTLAGVLFDVWIPVTMATAMGTGDGTLHYRATRDETSTIVRLKPDVTVEQARAEVAALGKRLAAIYPATNRGVDLTVTPLRRGTSAFRAFCSSRCGS
jgi:hypothetical protein